MTLLEALEKVDAARKMTGESIDAMVMLIDAEQTRRAEADRAAAKAGAEAGSLRIEVRKLCEENEKLRARVAELEATLDVEPCADCGQNCDECKEGAQ